METLRRDNPFVHVYATNRDTIVHIRQLTHASIGGDQSSPKESHDGVVMTLNAVSLTYDSFTSIRCSIHAGLGNAFDYSMQKRILNDFGLKLKMLTMMMHLLTKHLNTIRRRPLLGKNLITFYRQ